MRREGWALAFAMLFPTVMAWAYFVALAQAPGAAGPNRALQAAYSLGKVLQFSFPLLYLGLVEPHSLRPGRPHFRGLLVGLGFGLLVAAGTLLLYYGGLKGPLLRAGMADRVRVRTEQIGAASPATFLLLAGFLCVVHALLEEYYWRWFVFGRLRRFLRVGPAVGLSSLAFMAHHVIILAVFLPGRFFSAALPLSLCVAMGGAVWAWLYERNGSLYSPWLSHLVIDAAVMAVGYDLLFSAG